MGQQEFSLSAEEFARVRARLYEEAGISLSEAKRTLVVSRLGKLVRDTGLDSIGAYLDHLEHRADGTQKQAFVNALTTNLTRFYREEHHFDHLAEYVGALIRNPPRRGPDGRPRLRIWSAGCSTGQEPYTIALDLSARHPELRRWDFRILATDIDTSVVERARTGTYPNADLAGLSAERLRLFERDEPGHVRIPRPVRDLVVFKPLNLMGAWPMKGMFDAVFCRNVAIYFDRPTQTALFDRMGGLVAPGGCLYIGHSENLGAGAGRFKLVGKTIYRRLPVAKSKDAA